MKKIKIGIVVADIEEYKPLKEYAESKEYTDYSFLGRQGHSFKVKTENATAEVVSILSGIGKVNATAAATHLIDNGFDIILSYGLSGGISGVGRGDLSICDRFLEHDFDLTGIGYKPCEKPLQKYIYEADKNLCNLALKVLPNAKIGTAVSGDSFVCDEEVRNRLKNEFGAMSCDMETAAIAYVCEFSSTPFLALRRISDDAGSDAYESYTDMNTNDQTELWYYVIEIIKAVLES